MACKVMGILNVTNDSFYDGGRYIEIDRALGHVARMVEEGADYIDVGGESTRPGSLPVCEQEELDRVVPVIEKIVARFDIEVSVDTTKHAVAQAALAAGAGIVNDISGLTFDLQMLPVVAEYGASVVIMHTAARPEIMQQVYSYDNVVDEVCSFLQSQAQRAVDAGIPGNKIILDPGIGFGKSLENNYALIAAIPQFKMLGYPLLLGLSRKSLIGKLYGDDGDRLPATIALNGAGALYGADIIRVHDVKEHVLALRAVEMLKKAVS